VAQTTLFDHLIEWIDSKGAGWKSSTRNSKLEPGGTGTVETLFNEVLALNPSFKMRAAPYLAKAAPPPAPLMQHGARNRQKDEDGHWYEVPVQTQENSCGPCAIRLVLKQVLNRDVDEEYLRELVEVAEEGGAYAGTLGQGGVLKTGGAHDWTPGGNGTWLVPAALESVRPAINCSTGTDVRALLRTSRNKPGIGVVAWTGGAGLHYVVVIGPNTSGTQVGILDPFYGLQSAPVAGDTLGNYQPKDADGTILATATWHSWVCKVN
jgi:hypothetical protein